MYLEIADTATFQAHHHLASELGVSRRRTERRLAPRKPARVPGQLSIPGIFESIPCRVLDASATGARVFLTTSQWRPARLPLDLVLSITLERAEVICSVVWAIEREMGLKFRTAMRHR